MEGWGKLTGVTAQIGLKYEGRDTDRHIIDSIQYARSLEGSSRLYRVIAHFCVHGEVLKPRQTTELRCFSAPAKEGSYDTLLVILTALSHEYPIFSDVYKQALDWLIAKVSGFLKDSLSGQGNMKGLIETIQQQAASSSELNTLLANGLIKANDNLSSLHDRLIETLPQLVEVAKPHLRETLTPIGKTCSQIVQFADTDHPVVVTEAEAVAIRSDEEMVVGKPDNFTVVRLHSLNLDSGACRIELEGVQGLVSAKIDDITLKQPGNAYSAALNSHSALNVRARPVLRDGEIYRLFITESE
ncbi:hypothetical protein OSS47_28405 [Pseudomonas citronellolis]|uniref:DUF7946 domain-containing protein n=1 Tax=Pseudomonas citronellolis TaxID=53408 RepID=UPI00227085FC|nr:hypothetical protein [Pseudomonas citronellolis]WAB91992.1 hypothetical protein OSS47_28405 [Pseudomonas citronellolis]